MKKVMTRAWEIAREGVEKFGGKVKEYFTIALKLAWKEVKKTVAKLKANQWGTLQGVSYKSYQEMPEEEQKVIKMNFTYAGGEWVLKPDFDRNIVEITLDDWAKNRIARFVRRGKTVEEIIEKFDKVDVFLKEAAAKAIKEELA